MRNDDLDLIARYRAARQALHDLAVLERQAGEKGVTPERLAANEALHEIERRVPWHLR